MLKRLVLITVLCSLLTALPAQAAGDTVTRYLALAAQYFKIVDPGATNPCPTGPSAVVAPMVAASRAGRIVSASNVWAETFIGGCEIDLSRSFHRFLDGEEPAGTAFFVATRLHPNHYHAAPGTGPWARAYACAIIAHEYGHVLGLPDSDVGLRIMDGRAVRYDDPLCNRAAYGWNRIGHKDRLWLAGAGLTRHLWTRS
jgi:hypothetical protein